MELKLEAFKLGLCAAWFTLKVESSFGFIFDVLVSDLGAQNIHFDSRRIHALSVSVYPSAWCSGWSRSSDLKI
jgi:hypothetical protein